jgi:hypothetical protein
MDQRPITSIHGTSGANLMWMNPFAFRHFIFEHIESRKAWKSDWEVDIGRLCLWWSWWQELHSGVLKIYKICLCSNTVNPRSNFEMRRTGSLGQYNLQTDGWISRKDEIDTMTRLLSHFSS